jgi:hypothetical protein
MPPRHLPVQDDSEPEEEDDDDDPFADKNELVTPLERSEPRW